MALSMPFFVGDPCLTANLAQLAFDQFVKNLPGVAPLMIAAAFNDLITAIRHPYHAGLVECEVDRRVHRAEMATVRMQLDLADSKRQSQKSELERSRAQIQSQNSELERSRAQIQTRNSELDDARAQLQSQNSELDLAKTQRQSLQAAVETSMREQQSLHSQLQATTIERQSLHSQVQALQNELQSREIRFKAELKNAQIEIKAVLTQLDERTKTMTTANNAMVENLESQIAYLRREILGLRAGEGIDSSGSKSRSETWTNVKNANPNRMSLPLATCPFLPDHQTFAIDQMVGARYANEKEMYEPFVAIVGPILNSNRTANALGATVINTSNRPYLGVYSPDITVAIGGLQNPDSASIYMVIELKHPTVALESKGLGQAYDYSLAIRAAQGHRRLHVVMLSNFVDTHFVLLDAYDFTTRHFIATSLPHAISYIKHRVLCTSDFNPMVPAYSLSLGDMVRRLGTSKHSVVTEFDAPEGMVGTLGRLFTGEAVGTTMAVKRSSDPSKSGDITHEINILLKIKRLSGTSTIARLVHTSPGNDELGVMPVGDRVNVMDLEEWTAKIIIQDILAAIEWLHSKNILHRDVRIDNVVLHSGRARLIDFGAAIELPAPADTPYWGGYLCCPPELIGDFDRPYTPAKKHDLLAFVLMVALMTFPHTVKNMSSKEVSHRTTESGRLVRYWARLRTSSVWRPYVLAAEAERYEDLRSIADVFAML